MLLVHRTHSMHYIRAYIRVHNVLKIIQSFCQFLFTGEFHGHGGDPRCSVLKFVELVNLVIV